MTPAPGPARLFTEVAERARRAVGMVFALNGLAFASWASRTPAIRDALDLTTSELGLLLLCLSIGTMLALPLSGPVVHRVGPARAVLGGGLLGTAGLAAMAAGLSSALVVLTGIGLVLFGLGSSTWDVAMNVEGADVERRLGRTLMPRFHAGWSTGTVAGALVGASCAAVGIPLAAQLVSTGVVVLALVAVGSAAFVPVVETEEEHRIAGGHALLAWRERRTLLLGLLVLAFAFTEGVANDWLALAFVDGLGTSEAWGAIGFGVFVAAMTASRMFGHRALERWGRVSVLRGTSVLACAGLTLVIAAPSLPWGLAGAVLWGLGAALGFPLAMTAAADDPRLAAVRVSVVATIGYTAFLAGPPLVGFLAEELGIRPALVVVLVALAGGLATAGASREQAPT